MIRRGSHGPMDPGWQVPPSFVDYSVDRLRASEPGRFPSALSRLTKRPRPRPKILPKGDVGPAEPSDPD
jgi:hypothetical protein